MTSRPFSGPFDNQHSEIQRLSAILGFFLLLNTITKNKREASLKKKGSNIAATWLFENRRTCLS